METTKGRKEKEKWGERHQERGEIETTKSTRQLLQFINANKEKSGEMKKKSY